MPPADLEAGRDNSGVRALLAETAARPRTALDDAAAVPHAYRQEVAPPCGRAHGKRTARSAERDRAVTGNAFAPSERMEE